MMSGNNTTNNNSTWEARDPYTCARFLVSAASFSVLLLFNLLINWTIVRAGSLRRHARFALLFHLLLSALLHLGTRAAFHLQVHRGARPGPAACRALVTALISSASNILLTLTAMALDRLCAICHPLRYSAACGGGGGACAWPWLLGALTWLLSLAIPLSLLHQISAGEDGRCGREQLRVGELQKVLFVAACACVILYSYARILVEARRSGALDRRNRAARRTIALHGTQLAVHILPTFCSFALASLRRNHVIGEDTKERAAVLVFAFFSLAQCVAPVVYGLRKEELLEQLRRRFPWCCRYLKRMLGWTVRANWPKTHHSTRERTLTAQTIISQEIPQVPQEEEEGEEEEEENQSNPVRNSNNDSLEGDSEEV